MPSLLRLLTPKPRAIERDRVAFAIDAGRSIEILRVRDPRARRIKLSVDERGARLTLPLRASLVSGERFLHEHREWLVQQLLLHAHDDSTHLVRGETASLPLRGGRVPLRWQAGRYTRLQLLPAAPRDGRDEGMLLFDVPARAGDAALRRALRDFYQAEARADVGGWLPRYLPTLPRAPSRIVFKPMSSQWGSLSPDGVLALDLALVLGRPAAFEYVLVHELCHLVHADHSRAFWREVEARFPDWRPQRDYFHAQGGRLKADLRCLLSG